MILSFIQSRQNTKRGKILNTLSSSTSGRNLDITKEQRFLDGKHDIFDLLEKRTRNENEQSLM